ncbi:uncharacterized protein BDV14DRAFT_183168 [Aspergillus stella-maris]|uniref:uncharacterized protein n=1 Tax=Aspergillus stella-maris TaxID=1810926 RepID=UPI003CCCCCC0
MGWFWGSKSEDPVKKIDPSLREYLENEAPKKYVPQYTPTPTPEQHVTPSNPTPSESADSSSSRSAPSASLYPDGRYAHLWKTYKPPSPDDVGSDASGLPSLNEHAKERRAMLKRAAMENCALENEVYHLCLQSPTFIERITACNEKNKVFTRCYSTQTKFLQALGYATSMRWDDEREERIQMHADTLYHEMMDYEKRVEEAREAGQEPPPLKSLFNPQAKPIEPANIGPQELEIPGGEAIPEGFKPSKSLDQLTPHERELELRTHYARIEEGKILTQEFSPVMRTHDEGLEKRREKLVGWFGETVGNWMTK